MSISRLFVLHEQSKLYTIQTVSNALVIASNDLSNMHNLKHSLQAHHAKTGRTPNKCRMHLADRLYVSCDDHTKDKTFDARNIEVSFVNFRDDDGMHLLERVYDYNNAKIFLAEDFMMDESASVMTIHGSVLEYLPFSSFAITDEEQCNNKKRYLEKLINQ